jgi:hypothetical protein
MSTYALPGALLTLRSGNRKTGRAAALYISLNSCPGSCPFRPDRDGGCYAGRGRVGMITSRLALAGADGHQACLNAARLIRQASRDARPGTPLRLFVSGDAHCPECASEIAQASRAWPGPVWGYTHNWRVIPADTWHGLSVLASCETDNDVAQARAQGYAAARTFSSWRGEKAFRIENTVYIPCPEESGRDVTCADCRLCWRAEWLRASNRAIAFSPRPGTGARIAQDINRRGE